jgi:signal peptidase
MDARSTLKATARVAGILRWVLLIAATVIMGGVMMASLLGFKVMIVTSGSMVPTFRPGDAVIVRPGEVSGIKPGNVITFRAPGAHGMTTHRVLSIKIIKGTEWFQTKGDANPTSDPNLVPADAVYGIQKVTLPGMGRFLYFALTPRGKLVLLGLPICFLAAQEIGYLMRTARRRNSRSLGQGNPAAAAGPVPSPEDELGDEPDPEATDDPYAQVEAELQTQSARLVAAEDTLAELEHKMAELQADNGQVHSSQEVPPQDRGLELETALSG